MRIRNLPGFALAAALGAAVGGGAVLYFEAPRGITVLQAVTEQRTVRLLVAKRALAYGTRLQPGNLQWVEWPESVVPPGAFTSVEDLLGPDHDDRRFVLRDIKAGEPILESKISRAGEVPPPQVTLDPGMRAASVSVKQSSGVSGFIMAGDRVDVLLTRAVEDSLVSSVILQDVRVLAVDQRPGKDPPPRSRTVTLEVTAPQAQKLALAQQVGELSLTLRADRPGIHNFSGRNLYDLVPPEKRPMIRIERQKRGSDFPIDREIFPDAEIQ